MYSYIFKKPSDRENFVTQIGLFYDASELKLYYTIKSDEFSNLAKNYCRSLDLQYFSNDVSILEELAGNTEIDSSDGELYSMLKELGNFSAELYFSLKTPTKQDVERFCYNYSALPDRYDEGESFLYRNAFSIASFDGEKDWLVLTSVLENLLPLQHILQEHGGFVQTNFLAKSKLIKKKIISFEI